MSTQTQAYLEASKQSYSNQEGVVMIPSDRLSEIVEIPLGFQPLGICSQALHGGDDEIAIAAYYEPAICLAKVSRKKSGLTFETSWVRGVTHGIQSVRLFPDIFQAGGANRAQTVNFLGGKLMVSRNSERDFFLLSPEGDGKWGLTKKHSLPVQKSQYQMVHSALLAKDLLLTIESGGNLDRWTLNFYAAADLQFRAKFSSKPYRYGIGLRLEDSSPWTVTDFRSQEQHGIYREKTLMVPGVEGNGICFLADGSALVTRYGQAHPGCFNGIPGALLYIPSRLFEK